MNTRQMILTLPCPQCSATGTYSHYVGTPSELVEEPCPVCGADGRIESWRMADNIPSAVWTFRILECVVPPEYASLSDANKAILSLILACGIVDLSDGTSVKTRLWAMFDAGSVTRGNLEELLS